MKSIAGALSCVDKGVRGSGRVSEDGKLAEVSFSDDMSFGSPERVSVWLPGSR